MTTSEPETVKLPVTSSMLLVMFCTYKFVTVMFDAVT